MSLKSCTPVSPAVRTAASTAPSANPSRENASCVRVIRSFVPSNPMECIPGISPHLTDAMSVLTPMFLSIISARLLAVPLGESSLWQWCFSTIYGLYPPVPAVILEMKSVTAKKILTPMEKLDA